MNQIARTDQTKPPAPDLALNKATRTLVCWTPSNPAEPVELTRALSAQERAWIERRVAAIEAALAARDTDLTKRAVTSMMLSIPSGRATGDEAKAVVAAYVMVLGDTPAWAVAAAATAYMRGEVRGANAAFAPSAAEMHQEARRRMTPHIAERDRWLRILAGVPAPRGKALRPAEKPAPRVTSGFAAMCREAGVDPKNVPDQPPQMQPLAWARQGNGHE